ncbi:MAG: DNA-binding protein [Candidatus Actinomarinales bacterium]|nr:MAG: DNA-binding protein [Candidatus Actinomarinales bacterium]
MFYRKRNYDKVHVVKLDKDVLLLESLTEFAKKEKIEFAEINFIGAIQNAKVMYFDQKMKKYVHHEFPEGHEVLNGMGNISLLDGEPFVHVHVTLADKDGSAIGGHLDEGTKVWLIEAIITELKGPNDIERKFDDELCLNVWKD